MKEGSMCVQLIKRDDITRWMCVLFAFGIVLLSAKAEALKEEWKYLCSNDKGESFFYDSASVLPTGPDVITLWTRQLTREAPTRKMEEINCKYKIIRDRQVIVESSGKAPNIKIRTSEWRAMEKHPDTQALYKAVCR
jgi:hypothetical protein